MDNKIGTALTSAKAGKPLFIGLGETKLTKWQLRRIRVRWFFRWLRGRGSRDGRVLFIRMTDE